MLGPGRRLEQAGERYGSANKKGLKHLNQAFDLPNGSYDPQNTCFSLENTVNPPMSCPDQEEYAASD